MKMLSEQDKTSRRAFDWRVLRAMCTGQYDFSAYYTAEAAASGSLPIEQEQDARYASHYRFVYNIPTLIGPGKFSRYTIIRVDVSDPSYPFIRPTGWVVDDAESRHPYSPHFQKGSPNCDGTIWKSTGQTTLGHYARHLAKLLNWDERLRPGYTGWNGEAIEWWRAHINQPLTPNLVYPVLPVEELYGEIEGDNVEGGGFRSIIMSPNGFRRL